MRGIEAMARELVQTHAAALDGEKGFVQEEKPSVGKCPRCGSPVHEGKKNYYCSNKECAFVMWKNDRFFEERKTAFSPKIAAALLKSGKANVKKLYSPKTGKTYDGTIVLADTGGKYVNYRIEVQKTEKLNSKHRKRVPTSVKSPFRYDADAPDGDFACWEVSQTLFCGGLHPLKIFKKLWQKCGRAVVGYAAKKCSF